MTPHPCTVYSKGRERRNNEIGQLMGGRIGVSGFLMQLVVVCFVFVCLLFLYVLITFYLFVVLRFGLRFFQYIFLRFHNPMTWMTKPEGNPRATPEIMMFSEHFTTKILRSSFDWQSMDRCQIHWVCEEESGHEGDSLGVVPKMRFSCFLSAELPMFLMFTNRILWQSIQSGEQHSRRHQLRCTTLQKNTNNVLLPARRKA